MQNSETDEEDQTWTGDSFGRKPLADYLSASIRAQSVRTEDSVTVALDADWGAGKTFFCRAWLEDLKASSHPVAYFDAWENDVGDEPAIALMVSILDGLDEWEKKLPKGKAAANAAKALTQDAVRSLRSALLPAAGVMAKGVVKKITGVAVDEVVEALSAAPEQEIEIKSEQIIGAALDQIFTSALSEQRKRKTSLSDFRNTLAQKLQLLADNTGARMPYFVFIDELDRCRPSYAVKLLEEVKHIFCIPEVCYVFSTNIDQLQNSVRAAYGADFDGRRYLRRMFAREYLLPSPSQDDMVRFATSRLDFVDQSKLLTGLPRKYSSAATAWGLVAKAMFPSDVRAQLQALELLRDVKDVASQNGKVHFLWLSYLTALYVIDSKALARIADSLTNPTDDLSFVRSTMRGESQISYVDPSDRSFGKPQPAKIIPLSDIVATYLRYYRYDTRKLFDLAYSDSKLSYPSSIAQEVADNTQSMQGLGSASRNSLADYPALVLLAGRVAS